MTIDVKYRAAATAVGGRHGSASTDDGALSVTLVTPRELGGSGGEGTNPEQLFATGYSACFLSALQLVARQQKVYLNAETSVKATVGIGQSEHGGFGLAVELLATILGVERSIAEQLVRAAHQVCPYSNATRNNVAVTIGVA